MPDILKLIIARRLMRKFKNKTVDKNISDILMRDQLKYPEKPIKDLIINKF